MRKRRGISLALPRAALVLIALGAASGCYRRVIRSEGWNYEETVVEEPYAHDGPVDDMLFGKRESERRESAPSTKPRSSGAPRP